MSTIAVAQASMRYLRAAQRAGCHNCTHAEDTGQPGRPWCKKGGYTTTPLAICAEHQREQDAPLVMAPMERSR